LLLAVAVGAVVVAVALLVIAPEVDSLTPGVVAGALLAGAFPGTAFVPVSGSVDNLITLLSKVP
jgi:hypothetical protein